MKVAISVVTPERDAILDTRFGRAEAFVVVETETDKWQGYANPAAGATGGAGVQAAEFIVERDAEAAISGAFGPNAYDVLSAANIGMYRAKTGTAAELVQKLKDGALQKVEGYSRRGGRGGGGRRRGRGR
jgi:predicted Fe-Mo cluster-binding NifX family protein